MNTTGPNSIKGLLSLAILTLSLSVAVYFGDLIINVSVSANLDALECKCSPTPPKCCPVHKEEPSGGCHSGYGTTCHCTKMDKVDTEDGGLFKAQDFSELGRPLFITSVALIALFLVCSFVKWLIEYKEERIKSNTMHIQSLLAALADMGNRQNSKKQDKIEQLQNIVKYLIEKLKAGNTHTDNGINRILDVAGKLSTEVNSLDISQDQKITCLRKVIGHLTAYICNDPTKNSLDDLIKELTVSISGEQNADGACDSPDARIKAE